MKKILLLLLFCVFVLQSQAQQLSLEKAADSLQRLGTKVLNDLSEEERVKANYQMIRLLSTTLRQDNAFLYPFDELEGLVSIKKSPDNKFRIFSWFVYQDEGAFRYYGVIQLNQPGKKPSLIPLIDDTASLLNTYSISSLEPNRWFGAVYYDIIPVSGKNPYYLLLGWKGKSPETSSKVIEVLTLKNNQAIFGLPVMESEAGSKIFYHRKVFTYDRQASMMLRYDREAKLIVFDHLVAPNDDLKKNPELFVPDLSYNAYKYKNGNWVIQENITLKNKPSLNDDLFVDPTKIDPEAAPIRQY